MGNRTWDIGLHTLDFSLWTSDLNDRSQISILNAMLKNNYHGVSKTLNGLAPN